MKVADIAGAGKILIGADGSTLYGFTNDVDAKSTCYSTCAAAWPPVIVDSQWTVGPGLDTGVFSTVRATTARCSSLPASSRCTSYSGDAVSGDRNGQGSGDVWFIVGSDAKLVKGASTATGPTTPGLRPVGDAEHHRPVGQGGGPDDRARDAGHHGRPGDGDHHGRQTALGKILVDAEGRTLYAFTKDVNGTPTCTDACAKAWPPATVRRRLGRAGHHGAHHGRRRPGRRQDDEGRQVAASTGSPATPPLATPTARAVAAAGSSSVPTGSSSRADRVVAARSVRVPVATATGTFARLRAAVGEHLVGRVVGAAPAGSRRGFVGEGCGLVDALQVLDEAPVVDGPAAVAARPPVDVPAA